MRQDIWYWISWPAELPLNERIHRGVLQDCSLHFQKISKRQRAIVFRSDLLMHLSVHHNTVFMQVNSRESFLPLRLHTEALTQITFQTSTWPIFVFQVSFPTLPFFRVIGWLHGQRKQDSPSQLSKILLICIFHFLLQRKGSLLKAVKSYPFPLRDFIFLKGLKFQLKKKKRKRGRN